jgi:DNA-directed RNA polymerase subunit RPC12/RpoP
LNRLIDKQISNAIGKGTEVPWRSPSGHYWGDDLPKRICPKCGPMDIGISLARCPICGERFLTAGKHRDYLTSIMTHCPHCKKRLLFKWIGCVQLPVPSIKPDRPGLGPAAA